MNIWIDCIPPKSTSQQKGACRVGRGIRFFKKEKVAQAERDLVSLFTAHRPTYVPDYSKGPLIVRILLVYPYRKSEPKKRTADGALLPCDTRPDLDNLTKMILDALTRCRYWTDDGQVASLTISKSWGPEPGIGIEIGLCGPCRNEEGGAR